MNYRAFYVCFVCVVAAVSVVQADEAFTELDINGDNVLSGVEAESVKQFDADGDGEITQQEYDRARQASQQSGVSKEAAERQFDKLDGNQDQRLSGTEMKGLEALDTNGDKRITLQEYFDGMVKAAEDPEAERAVVVPTDNKPFAIDPTEIVRLTGRGIAGCTITAEITGPAKVRRTTYLRRVVKGETPIGGEEKEFEIEATGKGEISVLIKVEFPTGSPPTKTVYRFSTRQAQPQDLEPQ